MSSEPISFYIPARNAERTLADCIAAVHRQTRRPDEFFLLVDPRSTDRTLEIARNSGVEVVEQTGPALGAARNQALTRAMHRWVACCDSAVLIAPEWLDRLASRRGEGAIAIGGRTEERTLNPFDEWRALHMPHHWGEHGFRNPFMLVSEVLLDREAVRAAGGYREDLNYYEDSDLCQRLREGGYDLLYEPGAVATHQRTDDLIGVLNLRWKYSEYRQRHLLDRYAGLLEKCRVNREYALNTLARSLARGREELAYISFLLFFHHLLMDFRSLLSRRPMITPGQRLALERELLACAVSGLDDAALSRWVSADLCKWAGINDGAERPDSPPSWPGHLAAIKTIVAAFVDEITEEVRETIAASAAHCHGQTEASAVPCIARVSARSVANLLDKMPLTQAVDAPLLEAIGALWPEADGIEMTGRVLDSERECVNRWTENAKRGPARSHRHTVVLAAHLETHLDPLGIFMEMASTTRRLLVCYQPPAQFLPGLDVMTPADLASAAAACGWRIERFETLVGRTRLALSREL